METDVDQDVFTDFNTFKSTQFFVTEFERSSGLLTTSTEETANEVELSWFESDSGVFGLPNWILISAGIMVVLFAACAVFICIQLRKNSNESSLQERAIAREIQLAKQEGVEIPSDLEKRLERFQHQHDDQAFGKQKGGKNLKEGGQKMGEYKVHPAKAGFVAAATESPGIRKNRNLTRYAADQLS